jgi:hypothetical protein
MRKFVCSKLKWTLLIGAVWLSGCVAPASSPSPSACAVLTLKTYSAAFNRELAAEIDLSSPAAIWPLAITDYVGLRDQVKACKG